MTNINAQFSWKRHPEAEAFILDALKTAEKNSFLKNIKNNLEKQCSTGLIEWVDHIGIKNGFESLGFVKNEGGLYRHPGAQLPSIVFSNELIVAISVDSIADFLQVRGLHARIQGSPHSAYRKAIISQENGCTILAVERNGTLTLEPITESAENYLLAKELWQTRERSDFDVTEKCAKKIANLIGKDRAACLVLECERKYWQARNLAGQIQKNRQDRLGMGWANHDHHTFRSARENFSRLVKLFETLGFHCRERYYSGSEAGWGAQIMENPTAKLVLFLDVDLHPGEVEINFAHDQLPPQDKLGTIGLWCALHGDSILSGGMHHLEAQFHFDELREDLKVLGVQLMKPFSDLPYLKQAFTQGELWSVDPLRVEALFKKGQITQEQADKFLTDGAIGSHLENLQRKEGYKGFNQKNVNLIIKDTDPRN